MTTSSNISSPARTTVSALAVAERVLPIAAGAAVLALTCVAWHVIMGIALGSLR
jgi:hypothetical protein